MISEFGIKGFDVMMTRIHKKFAEAMKYEFLNRNSYIGDPNYGNKKPSKDSLSLSKEAVYKTAQRILIECIELYLPQRTIQPTTTQENEFDKSRDRVDKIIQSRESDVVIQPKIPQIEVTKEKDINITEEEKKLEISIKDEVPNELPRPKFIKPNPSKSKKKDFFKQKFINYGGGARPQLDNNIKSRTL